MAHTALHITQPQTQHNRTEHKHEHRKRMSRSNAISTPKVGSLSIGSSKQTKDSLSAVWSLKAPSTTQRVLRLRLWRNKNRPTLGVYDEFIDAGILKWPPTRLLLLLNVLFVSDVYPVYDHSNSPSIVNRRSRLTFAWLTFRQLNHRISFIDNSSLL